MKYLVIVEQGVNKLRSVRAGPPGLRRSRATREEATTLIHEAIEFHLEGMKADGQAIPPPSSTSELVEVSA